VGDRYVTTAVIRSKPLTVKTQGRIHTIAVEKIYPGFAVVMVDDSFRARLEPSAYNGPRDLIEEGKEIQGESDKNKDGRNNNSPDKRRGGGIGTTIPFQTLCIYVQQDLLFSPGLTPIIVVGR
jgi:hypothetical protein